MNNQNINGSNNVQQNITIEPYVDRLPSILGSIIPGLVERTLEVAPAEGSTLPYGIQDKINFNNVLKYKRIIQEYHQYGSIVDFLYDGLEEQTSGVTKKIYGSLRNQYLQKFGEHYKIESVANPSVSDIEIARKYADTIMDSIVDNVVVEVSKDQSCKVSREEATIGATIVVCHAFINCKILEKPVL